MCGLPTWLDVEITRSEGVSFRVSLQGRALCCETWSGEGARTTTLAHPSSLNWREFLSALEEVKLWEWEPEYANNVSDGSHWYVEIVAPGRQVNSSGTGAYPAGEAFPHFCQALQNLLITYNIDI